MRKKRPQNEKNYFTTSNVIDLIYADHGNIKRKKKEMLPNFLNFFLEGGGFGESIVTPQRGLP